MNSSQGDNEGVTAFLLNRTGFLGLHQRAFIKALF